MTELVRTYKITDSGAWGWETEEASGGGGGSLPDWWTVDNDAKTVEMAGSLDLRPPGIFDVPSKIHMPTGSLDEATPFAQWFADDGTKVFEFNSDSDLDVRAPAGWAPVAFIFRSVDHPNSSVSLRGWAGDDSSILRVKPNDADDNTYQLNGDGSVMFSGSLQDEAMIQAGQVYVYFDPTNGAAKVKFQGKQADGTIRTGEVALS